MSKYREGSLEAPVRHPLNWQDEDFYNEQSLNQELERVFDICHGCRRCVSLCKSFPTLFDLVDESETLEVESVDKADYKKVVDQCYLCDLCYMTKCPYVPPHEWNVDFPHLMLRAKAIQFKKGETKRSHKVLTSPQQVGSIASKPVISSIVNWSNSNKAIRKVTENIMGVHVDAVVPKYHSKTLTKLFVEDKTESKFKVAIFGTCYGEYNDPKSVIDLVDVLRHNNVEVKLINNTQCCGMPKMELGDLETVVKYANENISSLKKLVGDGYKLIAPIPSCVLMFKNELPMIISDNEDIKLISQAFFDPFEYLSFLNGSGELDTNFSAIDKDILYQMACHQRVQNIGSHTKKILGLIPDLNVNIAERCSGHDGTYGVRKETHTYAVKIGKPVAKKITNNTDLVVSDCVMAGNHIAHIATQNIEAIHPITLVKMAYCL
ncbi:heterodisulfide reductase-related iron-sulfur binding cluster [Candidatus Thioglobus sp.]|nr:heterodisulfide reductase-related iron-sulfur binding cluster [Candidatus Thioglobus sp.]